MATVKLFQKGTEDIFYDRIEGDTIVDYYLICELDKRGMVEKSCSFAYSASHDTYFFMNDNDAMSKIKVLKDAEDFDVCFEPASVENETRLSNIMKISEENDIFNTWMAFHRQHYDYLYNEDN